MDLENIMLHKLDVKGQEPYDFTQMWDIKKQQMNKKTKKSSLQIQTTVCWLPQGKMVGRGRMNRVMGSNIW